MVEQNAWSKAYDATVRPLKAVGGIVLLLVALVVLAVIVLGLAFAIGYAVAWGVNAIFGVSLDPFLLGAVAVVVALYSG